MAQELNETPDRAEQALVGNVEETTWKQRVFALMRERLVLVVMVAILLILVAILIWPYLITILGGIAAVVILKPLYDRFIRARWTKGDPKRAAGATVLLFAFLIALPLVLIIGAAVSQAVDLVSGWSTGSVESATSDLVARIEALIQQAGIEGVQLDPAQISQTVEQVLQKVLGWFIGLIVGLGQSLPEFMANAVIVLVLMMVLLPLYRQPGKNDVLDVSPFPREITQLFLDKADAMIVGMFKGTLVISVVQGAAMGVVLWIAGVPYVVLLSLLSMFLALIPMVGISLVAWPVGIALLLTGQIWQGIFVIAAFLIVVANLDVLLRPRLVPKGAYLNPALVILSVFGGLQLMGFIGIIYGPVIMILLVTSIEVYSKYMLHSDLELVMDREHVDLEELGLADEEEKEAEEDGKFLDALKDLAKRFRPKPEEAEDKSDDSTELQEPTSDRSQEAQE